MVLEKKKEERKKRKKQSLLSILLTVETKKSSKIRTIFFFFIIETFLSLIHRYCIKYSIICKNIPFIFFFCSVIVETLRKSRNQMSFFFYCISKHLGTSFIKYVSYTICKNIPFLSIFFNGRWNKRMYRESDVSIFIIRNV